MFTMNDQYVPMDEYYNYKIIYNINGVDYVHELVIKESRNLLPHYLTIHESVIVLLKL